MKDLTQDYFISYQTDRGTKKHVFKNLWPSRKALMGVLSKEAGQYNTQHFIVLEEFINDLIASGEASVILNVSNITPIIQPKAA